jgi:hypothetical protein
MSVHAEIGKFATTLQILDRTTIAASVDSIKRPNASRCRHASVNQDASGLQPQ